MSIDDIITKRCTACLIEKELNCFYQSKLGKYGVKSACKICSVKQQISHYRTVKGLISRMHSNQIKHSKIRRHIPPDYSLSQLTSWVTMQPNFDLLYENWKLSGYLKNMIPSCDRLSDYAPYTLENLRLTTWRENNKKLASDKINGINKKQSVSVLKMDLEGNAIKEYYSMQSASRDSGINAGGICLCCKGDNNTAGGFTWMYA